ncbi:MAG: hypothetical protein QF415_01970 [Candidatus Undinarchaeales archaeon]|jgi:hypothetical protein|nr:hypothetical protein [Candidatus Undinarchaeales archaeon]MDP7493456.1 hypothetical protein [Candidatus Undinarchaeales archaeon]
MGFLDWVRLYTSALMYRRDSSRLMQMSLAVSTLWLTLLLLPYIPNAATLPRIGPLYRFATLPIPVIGTTVGTVILLLVPPLMGIVVVSLSLFQEQHGYMPRTPTESAEAFGTFRGFLDDASAIDVGLVVFRGLAAMFHWLGVSILLIFSTVVGALRSVMGAEVEDVFYIPARPMTLDGLTDALADGMRATGTPPLFIVASERSKEAPSTVMRVVVAFLGRALGPIVLISAERLRILVTGGDITALGGMQAVRQLYLQASPRIGPHIIASEHPLARKLEASLNDGQMTSWNELNDLLSQEGVTLREVALLADKAGQSRS